MEFLNWWWACYHLRLWKGLPIVFNGSAIDWRTGSEDFFGSFACGKIMGNQYLGSLMATANQSALARTLVESIMVVLPLWVILLRYISHIGTEDIEVEAYQDFLERFKVILSTYATLTIVILIVSGVFLYMYFEQAGTIDFLAMGMPSPGTSLGIALLLMILGVPLTLGLILGYVVAMERKIF